MLGIWETSIGNYGDPTLSVSLSYLLPNSFRMCFLAVIFGVGNKGGKPLTNVAAVWDTEPGPACMCNFACSTVQRRQRKCYISHPRHMFFITLDILVACNYVVVCRTYPTHGPEFLS